jgi:hypothetical protein
MIMAVHTPKAGIPFASRIVQLTLSEMSDVYGDDYAPPDLTGFEPSPRPKLSSEALRLFDEGDAKGLAELVNKLHAKEPRYIKYIKHMFHATLDGDMLQIDEDCLSMNADATRSLDVSVMELGRLLGQKPKEAYLLGSIPEEYIWEIMSASIQTLLVENDNPNVKDVMGFFKSMPDSMTELFIGFIAAMDLEALETSEMGGPPASFAKLKSVMQQLASDENPLSEAAQSALGRYMRSEQMPQ